MQLFLHGGMHGRGECLAGGHAWQGACLKGGMWGGMHGRGSVHGSGGMHSMGACMAGGVHGGGHAWQNLYCKRMVYLSEGSALDQFISSIGRGIILAKSYFCANHILAVAESVAQCLCKLCQQKCNKGKILLCFTNCLHYLVGIHDKSINLIKGSLAYYHMQTKFAKVMFLHMSVILSTGEGGVAGHPSMHCRSPGPHPGGKLRGLAWGSPGPHSRGSPDTHPGGYSSMH